ncbi:MAG: hypothetical protein E7447_01800 [Ruminococcaceae bacterium]|nr:hypothetical protein [Oscillospiraceae bacterium]
MQPYNSASNYINGVLEYRYIIYDPWPEGTTEDTWPDVDLYINAGQQLVKTYDWIRFDQYEASNLDYTWCGFIAVQTEYSDYDIPYTQAN